MAHGFEPGMLRLFHRTAQQHVCGIPPEHWYSRATLTFQAWGSVEPPLARKYWPTLALERTATLNTAALDLVSSISLYPNSIQPSLSLLLCQADVGPGSDRHRSSTM